MEVSVAYYSVLSYTKKIDWACSRTGFWGEYLDLGRKWLEPGEDSVMSFKICTLHIKVTVK